MKTSAIGISVFTLVLASACGAPENGASNDGDAVEGTVETLHQLEVEGTTFTYLLDGDDLMLHVETSKNAPRLQVQTATGAEPTFLELFNALQPGGEPDEALVAAHFEGVELQGRTDDAVLPSSIVGVVEKTAADLEDCRLYFLGVWGGAFGGTTPIVNTKEAHQIGSTLQAATTTIAQKFMAAGACNFAASSAREVGFDKRVNSTGAWVLQLSSDIPVDGVAYIVHNPSAQSVNLRARMIEASNSGLQFVTARKQ